MNNQEEISFKYPYKIGHLMIWFGLPFIGLLISILIGATCYWLYSLKFNAEGFYISLFKGVVLLGVSLWMLASFVHWVRDRHAFITSYTLSDNGIFIELSSGIKQQISWSDFDFAIDHWTLRYIKIFSIKSEKPVTLIFGTPGKPNKNATANYELAKILVSSRLKVIKKYW